MRRGAGGVAILLLLVLGMAGSYATFGADARPERSGRARSNSIGEARSGESETANGNGGSNLAEEADRAVRTAAAPPREKPAFGEAGQGAAPDEPGEPAAPQERGMFASSEEGIALEATWRSQPEDHRWTAERREYTVNAIADARVPGDRLVDVDCRSKLCRVRLRFADTKEASALLELRDPDVEIRVSRDPEDAQSVSVFIARSRDDLYPTKPGD